jgi:hypothetical protein
LRNVVEAAKLLEGELYPTASSVIPFLDLISEDLKNLIQKVSGVGKSFVEKLQSNLGRRFQDGYKQVSPYNYLTLLDIRFNCIESFICYKVLILDMLICIRKSISKSAIVQHMVSKHRDKEAVKVLHLLL